MASSPAGEGAPEEAPLSEALASPAQELPSLLSTPAAADSPAPAQASAVVMLTVDDDGDGSLPVGGDPEYGEMDGLIDRSTPPPDKVPLGSAVDDGTAGQAPPPPAAVGPSAAHQAFLNLIHWRPPLLTALVFAFVNIFCLLVIHYHFTVLGLLANMVLCAIFAHVLYRLMAQAYLRFTNQRLEPYSAFKQRVGSQYSRVIDLAQVEETMAEVASRPIRVDFISPMAEGLEGFLTVCLGAVKDAILLKSFGTCCKVTAAAWGVTIFCASFDTARVAYAALLAMFTLPKLWSMRAPAVDGWVVALTIRGRQLWAQVNDNVLSKIPDSVLKDL